MKNIIILLLFLLSANIEILSQRVAFINSKTIREKFPEAQQAQQRVQSMNEEWKREIDAMQQKIDNMEFELKKNRLVWTESERIAKENELLNYKKQRDEYARQVYETNGKFDNAITTIFTPVEEKIYAAVQQVAADKGFDIILDQSIQPLPYVNYKYDLTIDVLKVLGVDVSELEKELQDKIEKDPRNAETESKVPRRRSRTDKNEQIKQERQFDERETPKTKPDPDEIKELSKPKNR